MIKKIITVVFSLAFLVAALQAGEFHVDKGRKNSVKFISDAPIEDFEGVTDKIDGYLYWEGDNLTNKSELYFEVELNTLDTGIGLRNRHMRENYLHTDDFPLTHFKGKLISSEQSTDSTFDVKAEGEIYIHGITKPLSVQALLIKISDAQYRVQVKFVVALTDFNIEVPSIMFFKIDEHMDIVLDVYLRVAVEQ